MRLPAVAQQRPALDRQNRRLVRPLLGEFAPPVHQIMQARNLVRTEPRKKHLVVRGREHIGVVDLQSAELPDCAAEIAHGDRPAWPRAIAALGRESNPARLTRGSLGTRFQK